MSLIISDAEHFRTCFLVICISSLEKYLFKYFAWRIFKLKLVSRCWRPQSASFTSKKLSPLPLLHSSAPNSLGWTWQVFPFISSLIHFLFSNPKCLYFTIFIYQNSNFKDALNSFQLYIILSFFNTYRALYLKSCHHIYCMLTFIIYVCTFLLYSFNHLFMSHNLQQLPNQFLSITSVSFIYITCFSIYLSVVSLCLLPLPSLDYKLWARNLCLYYLLQYS